MMFSKLNMVLLFALLISGALSVDYNCPPDGQYFYRYPYDCAKFIECNKGIVYLQDCIPGLYFSEVLTYCDFPSNVNCVVDEMPNLDCPAVNGEFATFLANKNDCTKYYECNWGVPIPMNCPEGLYFNDDLDVCDYPLDSGCVQP